MTFGCKIDETIEEYMAMSKNLKTPEKSTRNKERLGKVLLRPSKILKTQTGPLDYDEYDYDDPRFVE
jgi:hypothetical protein